MVDIILLSQANYTTGGFFFTSLQKKSKDHILSTYITQITKRYLSGHDMANMQINAHGYMDNRKRLTTCPRAFFRRQLQTTQLKFFLPK